MASCFVLIVLTITSVFLWAHQALELIEMEVGGEGVATAAPPEASISGSAPPVLPEPPPSLPLEGKQTIPLKSPPRLASTTLPASEEHSPDDPAAPTAEGLEDPLPPLSFQKIDLAAPRCEGIYVYIVSTFDDPAHSVATLTTRPKKQGKRVWVGQRFGEYRVLKIDYNPRYFSSAVWLEADLSVCQVLLRDEHPVRERISAKAARGQALAAKKARARAKKAEARKRRIQENQRRRARRHR